MGDLPEYTDETSNMDLRTLAKRRLILLDEIHRRFDAMPDDTLDERLHKVYTFIKYTFKYPYGIDHPELFEE